MVGGAWGVRRVQCSRWVQLGYVVQLGCVVRCRVHRRCVCRRVECQKSRWRSRRSRGLRTRSLVRMRSFQGFLCRVVCGARSGHSARGLRRLGWRKGCRDLFRCSGGLLGVGRVGVGLSGVGLSALGCVWRTWRASWVWWVGRKSFLG